jgi:AraC-like DNA-binding protein
MRIQKLALFILFFIISTTSTIKAQENKAFVIPDSLKNMSFEELEKKYMSTNSIKDKCCYYGNTYYKKSKKQNDKIILANGMYMMAYLSSSPKDVIALKYSDSIITLTKDLNDYDYPAKGYIAKGHFCIRNMDYKSALTNAFIAEKYSAKAGNIEQNLLVKQQIGLMKIDLGKLNEALLLFKENYNYFKKKNTICREYIYSGWVLSDIYIRLKKPDIALEYINELLSKIKRDNLYYRYLIMYKGICYHLKTEYAKSNEFLDSGITLLKPHDDQLNLAVTYYYRGENILKNEKNIEKAKKYFQKADTLITITKEYCYDIRDIYTRLIEITKKQKNDAEQLIYLNKLIEIDQFIKKENDVVSETINHNYDTPHLLAQKEQVISSMNKEKYTTALVVGGCFIIVMSLFLFYFKKSQKEKQLLVERFDKLMQQTKKEPDVLLITNEPKLVIPETIKTKSKEMPKDVEVMIAEKLNQFEIEKGYLQPNIMQTEFAKRLNTNSTYISNFINKYKGKNFNVYINDLRIDYAVAMLKEDARFRTYTIETVGKEIGFSNTQSFSKAFFNKTGLQPSYFIKKLAEDTEK